LTDVEQDAGINTPLIVNLVDIGAVTAQLIGQPDRGSALPFQFRFYAHPDVEWFLVAVHVMILVVMCMKLITIYKKSVGSYLLLVPRIEALASPN
jgi:hypothetical protein